MNHVKVVSASWQEAEKLVGKEFLSNWLQVGDDRIEAFEWSTYVNSNENMVNLDLYPKGLVEGFHSLSLLDYLVNEVSFIEDKRWSGWNYGVNRVRFVSPITSANRIRARGSVTEMQPKGEDLLVKYEVSLEVEGREKPGMVAEWLVFWTIVK